MQLTAGRYWKKHFFVLQFVLISLALFSTTFYIYGCAATGTPNMDPVDISLLDKWSGDYPVSELARLPAGQQDMAAGYINDTDTFVPIWRVFMPTEILPAVDFSKNIVVFTRNVQFYNRTSILKITLQDGNAEIIAMETMSAIPIEEKVAMAMAVIPRKGIMTIQSGAEKIKVTPRN
jgi:hypothetical protein